MAVASAFLERKFSRLVDYAHDSGGEVYFAAKRETLEDLYARISEEARNQYTLAYVPRGTDRSADYHNHGSAREARRAYHQDPRPLLQR